MRLTVHIRPDNLTSNNEKVFIAKCVELDQWEIGSTEMNAVDALKVSMSMYLDGAGDAQIGKKLRTQWDDKVDIVLFDDKGEVIEKYEG